MVIYYTSFKFLCYNLIRRTVVEAGDEIHVDIDSYEDGDGQALRDTLNRLQQWDQPAAGGNSSTNPSPADSTSTTSNTKIGNIVHGCCSPFYYNGPLRNKLQAIECYINRS